MLNLNFTPFPTITTQRLVLRQLQDDDVHELFALRTNELVNRFLYRPVPRSLNDVREFITIVNQITLDNEGLYWVITRKNEDKLLGVINLRNFSPEQYQAEIGYELHPDQQGKGFMHEAITHVLAYGFGRLGLQAIMADTVPGNLRSIRILEKHGFVKNDGEENIYTLSGPDC
ncbi:GNAT family N-acetyltransferase [Mucilaginibacter gotjawali]|uniref:Ribosomal-protein-alanine N-acetyltransferase n=2 Tax=Mucilaginibacter gotjawali TaxID=1550579 RepID=A0A839SBX9_9SPHI|nr:GNAT family N-acetyltransferase [Mucilaginibacter gotjawali]MBB3055665.1 ribosomal-protein-alanine N-acetyltransferase [Mucilaginibacter gotjawali]BAU53049.1 ribosomal-protein-S5-alanine N-acetyltransferase [Mucilaginibacter gotjawali]